MDEPKKPRVDRRSFLTGAATGAAAALIAQQTSIAAAQTATTAEPDVQASGARPASDFMVDIFKSLDMEYMFSMCASSFMGIHESVLNYAGNKNPQSITCTHEEISVAMANGYAKIEGKPVLVCAHATVGTQHATMALYDAWADRVPIYLVLGNTNDAVDRQGEVFWLHSAQDPCALVRDFTKWDDNPASLTHFAESAVRAYKIAMTPPMGPVAIVVDEEMQHEATPADARIPTLNVPTPPAADSGAIAEIAKLLVAAENPVILASRAARTRGRGSLVVELAEALQAGVVDRAAG
jgi:thiamine pyrophosphate-dependent acetolactate synthase large subunit-like protein